MKKYKMLTNLAITVLALSHLAVKAEVTAQSTDSFVVKHSFVSNKNISTVRHQFGHVGRWWTAEYSSSGKGTNMYFDRKGLFETMPNGKTITHLIKTESGNNQWTWTGALGQLKNENVDAQMKVNIKEGHHGTRVNMEYRVKSNALADHQDWPSYIDTMLDTQMNSLNSSLKKR